MITICTIDYFHGSCLDICHSSLKAVLLTLNLFLDIKFGLFESGQHSTDGSCNNALVYYTEDLLWDGKDCALNSMCCEQNHPPWFLQVSTSAYQMIT